MVRVSDRFTKRNSKPSRNVRKAVLVGVIVALAGIEPASSESESEILSIEIQSQNNLVKIVKTQVRWKTLQKLSRQTLIYLYLKEEIFEDMSIRKQFHFRPSANRFFAWDVRRLVRLSESFPIKEIDLSKIVELDELYWYSDSKDAPTVRSIAEHAQLIEATDLNFPIILSSNGRVMDGMHRVAKALMKGMKTIKAVQFEYDPLPDHVNVLPDELNYD